MSATAKRPVSPRSNGDHRGVALTVLFGVVGLVAFPLAGAALIGKLVDPLTFVALSLTALVFFGAAMMKLHRE